VYETKQENSSTQIGVLCGSELATHFKRGTEQYQEPKQQASTWNGNTSSKRIAIKMKT
jgi:hypothetical protein